MDGHLQFECPMEQHLSSLESEHSNNREDRSWNFKCRKGFVSGTCYWSDHDTLYDMPFNFTCDNDGIVTGLAIRRPLGMARFPAPRFLVQLRYVRCFSYEISQLFVIFERQKHFLSHFLH